MPRTNAAGIRQSGNTCLLRHDSLMWRVSYSVERNCSCDNRSPNVVCIVRDGHNFLCLADGARDFVVNVAVTIAVNVESKILMSVANDVPISVEIKVPMSAATEVPMSTNDGFDQSVASNTIVFGNFSQSMASAVLQGSGNLFFQAVEIVSTSCGMHASSATLFSVLSEIVCQVIANSMPICAIIFAVLGRILQIVAFNASKVSHRSCYCGSGLQHFTFTPHISSR